MKPEHVSDALNHLSDEVIEEADRVRTRERSRVVVQCVADVFRFHKNPSCSRCFFNPCRARYNRLFTLDWLMP